ncbi:hypothetical protein GCM10023176_08740 [Micromonospora coerulea]|uniref:DUF3558 domain-containing protein n=1 Tax=Micromonospora coerulea TaxID=47856 RepID=A0ABP8S7H3_9ACTN
MPYAEPPAPEQEEPLVRQTIRPALCIAVSVTVGAFGVAGCTADGDTTQAGGTPGSVPTASPTPDGPYQAPSNLCDVIDSSPLKSTNAPLAATGKHYESNGAGRASRSCTVPLAGGRLDIVAVIHDRTADAATAFTSAADSKMWKYRLTRSGPVSGVGQESFARLGRYDATSVVTELTTRDANVVLTVNAFVRLPNADARGKLEAAVKEVSRATLTTLAG